MSWPLLGATLGTRTSIRKTFALEQVIEMVVQLTMAAWLALEAGLLIRDRVTGKGGAARDRGMLWLNIIVIGPSQDAGRLSDTRRPAPHRVIRADDPGLTQVPMPVMCPLTGQWSGRWRPFRAWSYLGAGFRVVSARGGRGGRPVHGDLRR
jgi:hypothetical protein